MLLAVRPFLDTLDIEARPPCTGIMSATFAADVNHAVLSMLLAVRRRFASPDIEACLPCT